MKTNIHFQSLLSVGQVHVHGVLLDQVFIFTYQDLPQRFPAIPSNPITLTLEHLGKMFLDII